MDRTVDMSCRQCRIGDLCQFADSQFQQSLEPCSDDIESQIEYQHHDQDKTGNCRIFSGEDPVDLLTADPFLTFFGFYYCLLT